MVYHQEELDPQLEELLGALNETPARDFKQAERARERYLAQVRELKVSSGLAPTVSLSSWERLKKWMYSKTRPDIKKERSPMLSAVTAIVVTLTLLIGGASATVFAAQDALPDGALYPVKTISEDIRLRLSQMDGEASGLSMYLDYANKRVQEMASLANKGEQVPAHVGDRWDDLMSEALAIAAMEENPGETEALLTQIRSHLRDQDQIMARTGAPDHADQVMERVRDEIRNQLQLVGQGLEDPSMFQHLFRTRNRFNQPVEEGDKPQELGGKNRTEPQGPDSNDDIEAGEGESSGEQYGPGDEAGPGPQNGPGTKNEDPDSGAEVGPGPRKGPGGDGGSDAQFGPGPENKHQHEDDAPMATQKPDQKGEQNQMGGSGKP